MSSTITEEAFVRHRNLTAARDAFNTGDESCRRQLSREAHGLLSKSAASEPDSPQLKPTWSPFDLSSEAGHNEEGAQRGLTLLLRGAQHGAMASLLCASIGDSAGWPDDVIVRLNAAMLLCWAAYLGVNEALETTTYAAYYARERQRESWEMENFPEGEVEEMVQLYAKRGLPEHAARTVVTAMAASPEFFVDVMMLEELQMSPPPVISPLAAGVRIAGGMLLSGGLFLVATPLLTLFAPQIVARRDVAVWDCSRSYLLLLALVVIVLYAIGRMRASITTQQKLTLALQTCAVAVPCLLVGRVAGNLLQPVIAAA